MLRLMREGSREKGRRKEERKVVQGRREKRSMRKEDSKVKKRLLTMSWIG